MARKVIVALLTTLTTAGILWGQPSVKSPPQLWSSNPNEQPTGAASEGGQVLPAPQQFVGTPPPPQGLMLPPDAGAGPPAFRAPPPPPAYFSAGVEYLLWFVEKEDIPLTLVSTDPSDLPFAIAAVTQALTVGRSLNFEERPLSGARFSLGYWLADYDPIHFRQAPFPQCGVEVNGFFFGEKTLNFREPNLPILVRPFFDVNNRANSAFLVAAPGVASGTMFGSATVDMWGTEVNGWANVYENPPGQTFRCDLMAGFRYFNFDSQVVLSSQTAFEPVIAAPAELVPFAGNRLDITDVFQTQNEFIGGQVGLSARIITKAMTMSMNLKLGLGANAQEIRIAGSQLRTAADGSQTAADGGLLALASNSGTHRRTRITLLPEANFTFAFPINTQLTFFTGYTFLLWSDVVRPVDQIDRSLDITQIPNFPTAGAAPTGLNRPAVLFNDHSLFIHGLNVGMIFYW